MSFDIACTVPEFSQFTSFVSYLSVGIFFISSPGCSFFFFLIFVFESLTSPYACFAISSFKNQVISDQSLNCVQLFAIPWTAACQASLSITNSLSLFKLMSIESVMPSKHFNLCHPLLLPPSIFPSTRVFSKVSSSHQVAKVLEFQLPHQSFQ